MKKTILILTLLTFTACSIPVDAPPPPTALPSDTPLPTLTTVPAITPPPTPTATPTSAPAFCNDLRAFELLKSLRIAFENEDGALLASLISPTSGVEVIFIRNGKIINYDAEHAKFVFETTYQADWGLGAGSGEPVIGSFQETVLPSLRRVFTPDAIITCNDLKTGGVTYIPEWDYPETGFYSVHFPGTDQYQGLDWETWAVGMEPVGNKLTITALVHYAWEP